MFYFYFCFFLILFYFILFFIFFKNKKKDYTAEVSKHKINCEKELGFIFPTYFALIKMIVILITWITNQNMKETIFLATLTIYPSLKTKVMPSRAINVLLIVFVVRSVVGFIIDREISFYLFFLYLFQSFNNFFYVVSIFFILPLFGDKNDCSKKKPHFAYFFYSLLPTLILLLLSFKLKFIFH